LYGLKHYETRRGKTRVFGQRFGKHVRRRKSLVHDLQKRLSMQPLTLMKRPWHDRGVRDAVNAHPPPFQQAPPLRRPAQPGGHHVMNIEIVRNPLRPRDPATAQRVADIPPQPLRHIVV
jgi:hypothetical protein